MRFKKLLLLPLIFFLFSCSSDEPDGGALNAEPNPKTNPKPKPDPDPLVKNIDLSTMTLTSGEYHSCALYNQKIKCWGSNGSTIGRLGIESSASKLGGSQEIMNSIPYVSLGDGFSVVDVKVGVEHTCALSASGDVKCWGNGGTGNLGQESSNSIGFSSSHMGNNLDKTDLGTDFKVTKLFKGARCAQIQSGDVKCWGSNDKGQLGLEDNDIRGIVNLTMGNNLPKIDLGQTFDIKKIMVIGKNGCALNQSGDMKCWGDKDTGITGPGYSNHVGDGPLDIDGDNEMGDNLRILNLGSGFIVSDFEIAEDHTACALSTDNKLKCWGTNTSGQLGQDHTDRLGLDANKWGDNLRAINLGSEFTIKQVEVGYAHVCALSTAGELKCWGANAFGQLGYGNRTKRGASLNSMATLSNIDLGTNFTVDRIELGAWNSCAINFKLGIKCWGKGNLGQVLTEGTIGDHAGDEPNEMGNNLAIMKIFPEEGF